MSTKALSPRFLLLKEQVDIANKLCKPYLNGHELSLGGSQTLGYSLNMVKTSDRLVVGTIRTGKFSEINDAINTFCRTLCIISTKPTALKFLIDTHNTSKVLAALKLSEFDKTDYTIQDLNKCSKVTLLKYNIPQITFFFATLGECHIGHDTIQ